MERDFAREKPAMARGWIQDSEAPARAMLAWPRAMRWDAVIIEWAPVVQAVVGAWVGPYGEGAVRRG